MFHLIMHCLCIQCSRVRIWNHVYQATERPQTCLLPPNGHVKESDAAEGTRIRHRVNQARDGGDRGAFRHIVGEPRGLVGNGSRSATCVPGDRSAPNGVARLHLHASEAQQQSMKWLVWTMVMVSQELQIDGARGRIPMLAT